MAKFKHFLSFRYFLNRKSETHYFRLLFTSYKSKNLFKLLSISNQYENNVFGILFMKINVSETLFLKFSLSLLTMMNQSIFLTNSKNSAIWSE